MEKKAKTNYNPPWSNFFTCCIPKWKSPIMLTDKPMEIQIGTATGNFKKKVPTATCKLRDR